MDLAEQVLLAGGRVYGQALRKRGAGWAIQRRTSSVPPKIYR